MLTDSPPANKSRLSLYFGDRYLSQKVMLCVSRTSEPRTYSRLAPQTPEKCGANCGAKPAMRRRGANFLRKTGAPGAIPTRDLPLRRRTLYAAELREHLRNQQFTDVAVSRLVLIPTSLPTILHDCPRIATLETLGARFIEYF